jgi:hypothetical protein
LFLTPAAHAQRAIGKGKQRFRLRRVAGGPVPLNDHNPT